MKTVRNKSRFSETQKIDNSQIIYGTSETKFGNCLMALKDNKVCWVSFGDGVIMDISQMEQSFPRFAFVREDKIIEQKIHQYFEENEKPELLLMGTHLQVKVWEYLLNIPVGKTTSYDAVAKAVEHPKAVRAIASAIAHNKIAYFVPCHRVISKNGALSQYRWGQLRKLRMLRAEKAL